MSDTAGYNGAYSGQEIDQAIGAVKSKETTWDGKQNKLTGAAGQSVGFNSAGDAVAENKDFFLVPIEQNDGEYSTTVTMAKCLAAQKNGQILVAVVDGAMIPCSGYGGDSNNPKYFEFSTFVWPIAQGGYRLYRDNSISLAITYVDATQIYLDADSDNTTVTAAINDLKGRALPSPSSDDAGKVPTVNATGNGYELTTPSGGGVAVEPFTITDDWVADCYQNCYRIGNIAHIEISNGDIVKKINIGSITLPDPIKIDQGKRGHYICVGYTSDNDIAGIIGLFHQMHGKRIDLYDSTQNPISGIGVFQINFSFPIQE